MPSGRNGRRRYGLALLLGCYAVGGGFVVSAGANPPPAGSDEVVATSRPGGLKQVSADGPRLAPRSAFRWSVASLDRQDSLHGTATVGPDGTAEFGPYGSVHVAGMTLPEARDAVERRLSTILRQPRVALDAADAVPAVEWRANAEVRPLHPAQQPPQAPQQGSQFAVSRPADSATRNDGALQPVANNWQPGNRGGLLQRASGGQPELAPPPMPINGGQPPAVIAGPLEVHAPVNGGPLTIVRPPHGHGLLHKFKHGHHGPMAVPNVPTEQRKVTLPTYRLAPPDILLIDSLEGVPTQQIRGPHLIRPDGTIGVGFYGSVYVAGLTIEEARVEIARLIQTRLDPAGKSLKDVLGGLSVDVGSYNSRVYYVITDRLNSGEIVERIPITGNEMVLDAISQIKGLPPESSKRHIWVARRNPGGKDTKLPVDWIGITRRGEMATNYQILPGDRLYVRAEAIQRADTIIAKILSPIQRLFGAALLGAQTVNTIKTGQNFQ